MRRNRRKKRERSCLTTWLVVKEALIKSEKRDAASVVVGNEWQTERTGPYQNRLIDERSEIAAVLARA
jgi:hypothetical protein